MVLNIIGIGLGDEKDITLRGLELVKKSSLVYLENYTSKLSCDVSKLEKLYGKKIILADREMVEKKEEITDNAKKKDVSLLIIGDVFGATTHIDIMQRALDKKIKVNVVHNASILTAVGSIGLELYKFGKVTSIPFENSNVVSPIKVLEDNQKLGLHTLFLLDLRPDEDKFMTVNEGLKNLLEIENERKEKIITDDTFVIGCARLGSDDFIIKAGKVKDILNFDFGKPLHCLIVPGKMHFIEDEAVKRWNLSD